MTKTAYCLIVMLGLFAGCTTEPKGPSADLVFMGTVEKLDSSPLPQSRLNWIVQCRVDRVVSGEFSGKTLSFRVHSPSKSGLEVGKQYRITAKQTTNGYTVDQYQWMK